MKRTAYQPPDVFVPAGKSYSHGIIVEAGKTLYVAGQTSRDAQGNVVCKGDAAGQTRQVLENMKRVIEGAGGLMVPLTRQTLFIDVFARWKIPVILCARTRLGTINHTLLSIAAIRARSIPLHGVAFIGEANQESERIITEMGQVKRLGRLPVIEPMSAARLAGVFAKSFNAADFA